MPEGEISGLRDRLTRAELQLEQKATKDFVQEAADKMLSKAAANDRERNDVLLKLFDERLGAHRSAIITELERDLNTFKADALKMIEKVLHDQLPNAVAIEVERIEAQKLAEAERAQVERDKQVQRYKNRIALVGSCIVLLTALVTFWFSLRGQTGPTEIRHLDNVGEAITSFQ